MAAILQQFKTWIFESRSFVFSWYTKDRDRIQEPTRSLVELPSSIREELIAATNKLPDNPTDTETIRTQISETFEQWRNRPRSAGENSVAIVTSPVMVASRIIIDIIEKWAEQEEIELRILPWNGRPDEPDSIEPKLQEHLKPKPTQTEDRPIEVVVIPNLSWCFLRSMDGLDGIDYLQKMLLHDSERFWIIATGQVTWDYLNSITDIEADCGRVLFLPKLEGSSLQKWFQPVISQLEITFADPRLKSQILDADKDADTIYFEDLASVSRGISIIALQAFLASVSYEPHEDKDEKGIIEAQSPELPSLPDLKTIDHYLLYFLLLHGDLTLSTLAYSIGDRESRVRKRIKFLREEGLIEKDGEILKINPIYYPKLRTELINNNFVIDDK